MKSTTKQGKNRTFKWIVFSHLIYSGPRPVICNTDQFIWGNSFGTTAFETTFIWVHLRPRHVRPVHLRPHSHETFSFETYSFETTFIWDLPFETTFVWDRIHLRPHSFETTFILSHSFYATVKWICFDLLWIAFLWFAFHLFAGDLKFCKVSLQLKFCKVTPFRVHRWLTLGCKCTRTFKHRGGQKTLHTSGLEGSVALAPLKCYFNMPRQRIMFCVPARFLYRGALNPKNSKNLLKIFKLLSSWNIFSKNEKDPASSFFSKNAGRTMFSLFGPIAMCCIRHCEIFIGIDVIRYSRMFRDHASDVLLRRCCSHALFSKATKFSAFTQQLRKPRCLKAPVHLQPSVSHLWTRRGVTLQNFKWIVSLQNFRSPARRWKVNHKNVIHSESKQIHFNVE